MDSSPTPLQKYLYLHLSMFDTSTSALLRELHWLPVSYRMEYKIILLTFKVLHGMAPYYLRHLISVLPLSRYNLRRNDDYAVLLTFPKIRTKKTLADRSCSCAAPRLWNLLPTTIRSISSLDIFKIRLEVPVRRKSTSFFFQHFLTQNS